MVFRKECGYVHIRKITMKANADVCFHCDLCGERLCLLSFAYVVKSIMSMRFADAFAVRVSLCGNFAYYFIGHVYSYSAGFG